MCSQRATWKNIPVDLLARLFAVRLNLHLSKCNHDRGLVQTTATIVCACRSYYRPYQPAMTFEQWDIDDGTRKRRFRLVGRNTAIYVGLITFALIVAVGLFVFFNYYMACKTTPDANHAAGKNVSTLTDLCARAVHTVHWIPLLC